MTSNSQSAQDIFVLHVTNFKRNGTFVEIGSNHPKEHNNSFVLESSYDWKGLLVEYDKSFIELYKSYRPRSLYCIQDARTVPYREILDKYNFPTAIDYLQIDLDVNNRSTLDTLEVLNTTVFDKYKFASITFEHDIYTGNFFNTQQISRRIFKERGYEMVFPDVSVFWEGGFKPFEDWYVHPELVDMDYINKIRTHSSTRYNNICCILNIHKPKNRIILFLNHTKIQCGVYQYGLRLFDALKDMKDIQHRYIEVGEYSDYISTIANNSDASAIIYNYHASTMPWLNAKTIQTKICNIGIPHESSHGFFNVICEIDPTQQSYGKIYSIPRPKFTTLLENYTPSTTAILDFINYKLDDCDTFGSFGFGFANKGFDKIVQMVNSQYDKALIKLVIPKPDFSGENYDIQYQSIIDRCTQLNVKPGIKLMISCDFFTNDDVLYFLKSNTMNIFLYDEMKGRSISSVIDYAVSVRTPFGISNSCMFRHIYSDNICLYKTRICDCIANYNIDNINDVFNGDKLRDVFNQIYVENLI
jgi:hypothetical protein